MHQETSTVYLLTITLRSILHLRHTCACNVHEILLQQRYNKLNTKFTFLWLVLQMGIMMRKMVASKEAEAKIDKVQDVCIRRCVYTMHFISIDNSAIWVLKCTVITMYRWKNKFHFDYNKKPSHYCNYTIIIFVSDICYRLFPKRAHIMMQHEITISSKCNILEL